MTRSKQTDYNFFLYGEGKYGDKNYVNYLEKALMVNHETCEPIHNLEKWTEVTINDDIPDISPYDDEKDLEKK